MTADRVEILLKFALKPDWNVSNVSYDHINNSAHKSANISEFRFLSKRKIRDFFQILEYYINWNVY